MIEGVSRGVGGYEAMVDEVGVGRVGSALGGAMGKGRVRERRFELRDTEDSERMDRVSLISFVGTPPPHWLALGGSSGAASPSIASSRLLFRVDICSALGATSFRRSARNERDVFCKKEEQ